MNHIKRSITIVRDEGLASLVKRVPPYVYLQIWPYIPKGGNMMKNSIKSSEGKKVTDEYLPRYITQYTAANNPDYEAQYIDCIRRYINRGEEVVLIGGGEGISTVAAAKQVKNHGEVNVFEGGANEVRKTKETVDINRVSGIVTVHHAIVSNDYSLRSSAGDAKLVSPSELPECDTLAIDADGAEIPILEGISIRPNKLIVEHHAVPDDDELIVEYQPDKVRSLIQKLGYEIVEELSDPTRAYGRFEERIFVAKRKWTVSRLS